MSLKLKKDIKKKAILLVGILCIVTVVFFIFKMFNKPLIAFKKNPVEVEINESIDPTSYIEEIHGKYKSSDVKIDASQVDTKKLGEYTIQYALNDKKYDLTVKVVDTHAPTFKVKNLDIDVGMKVDVKDVVSDIKDATKTKAYFKKDYNFTKEGKQNVTVVVEDEGGNKTEKEIEVNIVKDTEKPELTGLHDLTVKVNGDVDYLSGLTAKDNRDPSPKITVDSSDVNLKKAGTYTVKYTVKDRSGNENVFARQIEVLEKVVSKAVPSSEEKIVYLTFDDGPSENTKKIIDILDKYDAKATFFVTGNNKKCNKYIKEAYEKGHTIGLHTYSHDYKEVYSSMDAYFDDLNKIGQMVKEQIGFVPKYIRFPGGSSNTKSAKYSKGLMTTLVSEVQNRGYQYYDWNADSTDAAGNNRPVSVIVKNATQSKAKNINLLMHDTAAKSTTVEALPKIIEHYQKLGYTFKGIDDTSFTPHHGVNN
ncbi:polysaccharide deacetylase family protein [Clostridium sp. AUH-JLR23]|uniref:polysaccharide deacetylase family protein n=1 Tax=Clostridium sp. AUH-JLR23 TaxID=1505062 RepID=UPI0035671EA5